MPCISARPIDCIGPVKAASNALVVKMTEDAPLLVNVIDTAHTVPCQTDFTRTWRRKNDKKST